MARAARVLLVRHGETNENVLGIIQGQKDTLLNAKGLEQAEMTGVALQKEHITRIVCSPLQRALHTARAISKHHPNVPLVIDPRLMERHFGVLEGVQYNGPREKPENTEGIESSASVTKRLAHFWDDLRREMGPNGSGTILLVSHGAALSSLVNTVMLANGHATCSETTKPSRFWNCSISEVDMSTFPAQIVRWADVSHLSDAPQSLNVDEAV
ncbi:phosphoglycerate mutase (2,3-diphosphoglycerate-independent) [Malassezia vespertilionis]|uniref:Phosphoglycerate mutase-like protein n=1 Tax=Malassezia vespertilionis TaxID=2020962 RepID=A0A2N1JH43_9BASI|nr:phosphoglycerate mutase (2,3-diphosphoglycerate-independent) [Malassezia vespertilionis]PKI85855.1 hypothetical protein MVES_000518 [Malassezia vespertilionis]WFD05232.1 phosphoglycerate mutase (2,3-diphosphoglycerate-independent) [Malassezia vespertilionis]